MQKTGQHAPRGAVLEMNQELRKERKPYALPDQSGHVAFQMPSTDYWFWVFKYPELGASDPDIARKAWRKFLQSDEGKPYLINPHEGKQGAPFTRGVIVR